MFFYTLKLCLVDSLKKKLFIYIHHMQGIQTQQKSNRMDQTERDHVTHHPQQIQKIYVFMFMSMYLGLTINCQVHKEYMSHVI